MTCAQISAFLFGTRLVSRNHDILYFSCCNVIPLVTRIISERHLVYYGREVMLIVLNSEERTIRPRLYALAGTRKKDIPGSWYLACCK